MPANSRWNLIRVLMYELNKLERYLRVNLLGPGPRLMKQEFTAPRSDEGLETLLYWRLFCGDVTSVLILKKILP